MGVPKLAMEPIRKHRGVVAPLYRENIDTDQIIPKQHLKRIERTGFAKYLFSDWRYHSDGHDREDFVLNHEHFRDATILVTGKRADLAAGLGGIGEGRRRPYSAAA